MSTIAIPGTSQRVVTRLGADRRLWFLATGLAWVVLIGITGCATTNMPPAPSLADIVRMSEDGLADDEIIKRLRESNAVYPLSASKILDLDRQGVATPVLDYMQQAYIAKERRLERLTYGEPYWRGHYWGYPCFDCPYPDYGVAPFYIYAY